MIVGELLFPNRVMRSGMYAWSGMTKVSEMYA
jgi:hypothetical protein